jgi:hypothetical protein
MDHAKDNAKKFRHYAAQCLQLAQRAAEEDRKVLIELARAWTICAEEAEHNEKSGE